MRRRKNELPAMLALTILLSGISEQPTWSYAAEQIEALEDLNDTISGNETQPDAGNMGEPGEFPASGEAGTNETGEKDTEPETGTGSGSGSETGDVSGPESEPETEDKSETRESESETASEVETESETEGSTENESEPETEASTEPESKPETEASSECYPAFYLIQKDFFFSQIKRGMA